MARPASADISATPRAARTSSFGRNISTSAPRKEIYMVQASMLWSAVAERSGDTAFSSRGAVGVFGPPLRGNQSAVAAPLCRRTPWSPPVHGCCLQIEIRRLIHPWLINELFHHLHHRAVELAEQELRTQAEHEHQRDRQGE